MLKQTFSGIEHFVAQEMMKLARKIIMHRLAVDPRLNVERDYPCSQCQGKLRIQEREQTRRLATIVGEVEYRRPYGVCDRCGISYAPMDCGLGIPPTGGSVTRAERVCHAVVTGRSFEAAADILKEHDQIELSAKQARILSESEGSRLVEERRDLVEGFRNGKPVTFPGESPDLIVVTADGGRIQTRQIDEEGGAWKEDKVGAVYDAVPHKDPAARNAEEYEGAKAKTKTYTATLSPWEDFGWMLCLEAAQRGYEKAKEKLFISDGAQSLRSLRQMHFKDATFILDWYHAVLHLADCAKAAFGEATPECAGWYRRLKEKLWEGNVEAILKAIEKESVRVGKPEVKESETSPRVILHRNLGYFNENSKAMDYPRFREQGWPIGSGVAEGAVKQFGMRLKGTEKFWNGFGCGMGAEEMLSLCALHRSQDGRWQAHWRERAQPYMREPRQRDLK